MVWLRLSYHIWDVVKIVYFCGIIPNKMRRFVRLLVIPTVFWILHGNLKSRNFKIVFLIHKPFQTVLPGDRTETIP